MLFQRCSPLQSTDGLEISQLSAGSPLAVRKAPRCLTEAGQRRSGGVETKATEPEVNRSIAEGQALGLRGTPTLFINGRKIGGLQWPDLELVINNELQYQAGK